MRRFTDLTELADDLLSRLETRADATRLLAYVGDFANVAREDAFMAGLSALEASGALTAKRARIDGVDRVAHITVQDPAALYAFRNRTPSGVLSASALQQVRNMPELPNGAARVLDSIEASWSRNVAWSGLRPGEADVLTGAMRLAVALHRIREQPGEFISIDYRTFSRRNAGDSKILERRTRLVVELLRRLYPETDRDAALEDTDLLASAGVVKFAQPLLLGGSIAMDGSTMPLAPFLGMPAEQVERISVAKPSYVLLVENYASFVRHCREVNRSGEGLVIYTGGFPARAVLAAILSLLEPLRCPVFHWGDLDLGGLRIFRHLEQALAGVGVTLLPHLMDAALLQQHGTVAERGPSGLPDDAKESAIASLWTHMSALSTPILLEQEELDPALPRLVTDRL